MPKTSVSIAIAGYGGTGVITTGSLLLKAAARSGLFGIAQRSFGPQIRGGESLSLLRLGCQQTLNLDDVFDCAVLLDVQHVERFAGEIALSPQSLVILPGEEFEIPDFVSQSGAKVCRCDFNAGLDAGGENIIALGLLGRLLGLDQHCLEKLLDEKFSSKQDLAEKSAQWFARGWQLGGESTFDKDIVLEQATSNPELWLLNGNEAAGFGALQAGVRFVAAYPITPASGALEWLAPNIEKLGGHLVQAEDELASINMIIGGSFGGVPSMTATSGPGLALMSESLGLAVASETPLLVLNVMRGGPSTGIPTKSEQSDLNIALHGLHGDAPHVVTAALSIADCAFTAGWSLDLAESLQTPVIMLSDQAMAQSDASIAKPALWPRQAQRLRASGDADTPYHRYALTGDGISPMAVPGEEGLMYTGDGLEHNEHGTPSAAASHHQQQLDKRANKLLQYDYGDHWAEVNGDPGDVIILCWGSILSVANEAAQRLQAEGVSCRVIALRLIAPLQTEHLQKELQQAQRVFVVEQSHGAQFLAWLRSQLNFHCRLFSLAKPGPLPIKPAEITEAVLNNAFEVTEANHAANC